MLITYRNITKFLIILLVLVLVATPFCVLYAVDNGREYKRVVVDAGHGGVDGGVQGSTGVLESDLNLIIARAVEHELMKNDIKVIMTRNTKGAIAPSKREDMKRRGDIIKNSNADMVVSIHINKFSDPRRRGVQVFYDDTKKWAREGVIMQGIMNEYVNKAYGVRSDIIALGGDYFVTKCLSAPSLIVECGFISNREDEELLLSADYRQNLAKYITTGVLTILSN